MKHYYLKQFALAVLAILLLMASARIMAVALSAQDREKDYTLTFIGIPVDGTKADMVAALKKKGFVPEKEGDAIKGEFNGEDVSVLVSTNHGKVDRVCVLFDPTNEAQAIIRYNNLLRQFDSNGKYLYQSGDYIRDGENVSYEMLVHNKQYAASFLATGTLQTGQVWFLITDGHPTGYSIVIYYDSLRNRPNGEDL